MDLFKSVATEELRLKSKAENSINSNFACTFNNLLKNLMADADTKAYIHWPNRKEKLIQFQQKLDDLLD